MPPSGLPGSVVRDSVGRRKLELLLPGHSCFLVRRALLAPFAEFLEFQLPLNSFFILCGVVVGALANRTL